MKTVEQILASYSSQVEVAVEIDSAKRSDESLRTWYYSTRLRETGAAETPANTTFFPFVKSLGPLSQSLAEDIQFRGIAENNPGSIVLVQTVVFPDYLSQMLDYTFSGYEVRIKIGLTTDLYADFATYRTTTVSPDKEPDIVLAPEGVKATFALAGALARTLNEVLTVKRYVGNPHCVKSLTSSGFISRAHSAIYDLTSFTLCGRFRIPTAGIAGASISDLSRKYTAAATNSNWQVSIGHASSGIPHKLRARLTVAGALTTLTSTDTYNDNLWHDWVFACKGGTLIYAMVDGDTPLESTISGNPNTQTTSIFMGGDFSGGFQHQLKIYNYYMEPAQARVAVGTLTSGDPGLIADWRMDDNTGSTVNDYSASNLDATIAGTVNTDWKWEASDQGDAELAGTQMIAIHGKVFNVQAQYHDTNRERIRIDDGSLYEIANSLATFQIRSRGTLLTGGGTDYTLPTGSNDAVVPLTAQEDEPVTFSLLSNGTDDSKFYPTEIVRRIIDERTTITISAYDIYQSSSLSIQCPWVSGYVLAQSDTLQQALQAILGESGFCYYEDRDGLLVPDFLTLPMGYGPYDEPVLVLDRRADSGVEFAETVSGTGDIGATDSCTITGYIKTTVNIQTPTNIGGGEPNFGSLFLVRKGTNYYIYFQSVGPNAGRFVFTIAGTTLYSPVGLILPNRWYFVAGVFDTAANTSKIYVGDLFTAPNVVVGSGSVYLNEVVSAANTGAPAPNNEPITVGSGSDSYYNAHAVQHISVWSTAKTLSELAEIMITPPVGNEADLKAYIPGNEGAGNPIEAVSGVVGTYKANAFTVDAVWAPRFTVDLEATPSVKLKEFRHLTPRSEVIINYKKNHKPFTDADLDTGVTQAVRQELKAPHLTVSTNDTDLKSVYKGAKQTTLDSPLADQTSAQKLLEAIDDRTGESIYIGLLEFPAEAELNVSRLACSLRLMDEIAVKTPIPIQLIDGKCFKVISVNHDPITLSTTVGFWGPGE